MSDPARDEHECCGEPMQSIVGVEAVACVWCLKWRHLLPVGDARRPEVVTRMNNWSDRLYPERLPSPFMVRDWAPGDLAYNQATKTIHTRHFKGWIPALDVPAPGAWDWTGDWHGK